MTGDIQTTDPEVDAATQVSPFDPDYGEKSRLVHARSEELRGLDSYGCHFAAPAWDGPVSCLTKNELHHRIESIGAHIGRLFTKLDVWDGWIATTPADLDRWVCARLTCLKEYDAR